MQTYDSRTVDSAGAFLVGELERMDQTLHQPLVQTSWHRDVDLREDVTIGDEASAYTASSFAAVGGAKAQGKNLIGAKSTDIPGINVGIDKTTTPLHLWAMTLGYSIPELVRSQQLGRPIDSQKHEGLKLKHGMDVDEMVYVGDTEVGCTGLLNNDAITPTALSTPWAEATPDQILEDLNELISATWKQSGYAVCPTNVLLPPLQFGLLTKPVTSAGSESILNYVARSCLSANQNGRPLEIKPVKWAVSRGVGATDRAMAYTKLGQFVRFPMVPLQRTPLQFQGLHQSMVYFGALGQIEFVYPETVGYADGL